MDSSDTIAMAAEEYRVWKKNTPYLYDFVLSHALEWPSLTVEWIPNLTTASAAAPNTHRLLLGTHTSDSSPNFLMLAHASFPSPPPGRFSPPRPEPPSLPAVAISRRAPHQGEINRARHMPQKQNVVATKTCGSEVHVFDLVKEESGGPCVALKGHETEGYGVDWSPLKEGWLLSGSYDSKICLWDVGVVGNGRVLDAKDVFEVMPVREMPNILCRIFILSF